MNNQKTLSNIPDLNDGTGNATLTNILNGWGINLSAGVNGGGLIHFTKYWEPFTSLSQLNDSTPRFLTINEDIAGFIPVGYYLATGKMAASFFTTGGAADLGLIGLNGAKAHNIPQIAIVALSASNSREKTPLQFTGEGGSNTIKKYKALLGDGCVVIDKIGELEEKLIQVRDTLLESKPTAVLFKADILSKKIEKPFEVPWIHKPKDINHQDIHKFLSTFPEESKGKKVIIYVGEEASRYNNIQDLITRFSTITKAPTLYSINSVNAISPKNNFAAGYIHLGFNDFSKELWDSLKKDDIVICIGYDPGEYEMNSTNVPGDVWHFTNEIKPYASINGAFAHRVKGKYRQVKGDLESTLNKILSELNGLQNEIINIPENLNYNEQYDSFDEDTVDLVKFYQEYSKLIKDKTIIVNDVCQAYKDFQRVTMRPIPDVEVFSSHRDSFMSGNFGVAIGSKLGQPNKRVEYFTGDGCFKYIGAALGFVKNFGIRVWVIDNGNHHIVDKGLDVIYGDSLARERHHAFLPKDDYVSIARAQGWNGNLLLPNLSNLLEIMEGKDEDLISTLIQMPIDGMRVIGQNARLMNLGKQGSPNL